MSENLNDIDRRINEHWAKGQFNAAYDLIVKQLVPVLKDQLRSDGFGDLTPMGGHFISRVLPLV